MGSRTPPAQTVEDLEELHELVASGAKIQVAEQYLFQPIHQARLAVIASGKLGTVSHAQVSAAHGYHGTSLLRHYLGISDEPCRIRAMAFNAPIADSPGRAGVQPEGKIAESKQTIAWLTFETDDGPKLGVFDWTGDIYFSYIRTPRILVRGEQGEISNSSVRYLQSPTQPMEFEISRLDAGAGGQPDTLEGIYHKGYLGGGEYLETNSLASGAAQPRLTDDVRNLPALVLRRSPPTFPTERLGLAQELANAVTLAKMSEYASGGPSFYSLADAAQDRYLDLMIAEAEASGEEVLAKPQVWADAVDGPEPMSAKATMLSKL